MTVGHFLWPEACNTEYTPNFVPVNNFKIKSKVKSQLQVGLLSGLEVNKKRITT
jgi:hypothetical protein